MAVAPSWAFSGEQLYQSEQSIGWKTEEPRVPQRYSPFQLLFMS